MPASATTGRPGHRLFRLDRRSRGRRVGDTTPDAGGARRRREPGSDPAGRDGFVMTAGPPRVTLTHRRRRTGAGGDGAIGAAMAVRQPGRAHPTRVAGQVLRVTVPSTVAAPPVPQSRTYAPGWRTSLEWLLRRFPEPESPVGESAVADRDAIAFQAAALRSQTPGRATAVDALLAALSAPDPAMARGEGRSPPRQRARPGAWRTP